MFWKAREFEVSILRKSDKLQGSFVFPIVVDIATVGRLDVVLVLPDSEDVNKKNKRFCSYYQFGIRINDALKLHFLCDKLKNIICLCF